MVIVKLFGNLRAKTGKAAFEIQGNTIREILDVLITTQPRLHDLILAGDELQSHVQVMVNGRNIDLIDGLDTAVSDTDQIAIFPPIAGG